MKPIIFILLLTALTLAGGHPAWAAEPDTLFDSPAELEFAPLTTEPDTLFDSPGLRVRPPRLGSRFRGGPVPPGRRACE